MTVEKPASQRSLGDRVTSGVAWSGIGNLFAKALSAATQIYLAWQLSPEDFGLAAIALSLTGVTQVLRTSGLHVLLVRSPARGWLRTASQAFYIALSVNLLLFIAVGLSSWSIASFYGEPRIVPLIWIAAAVFPLEQLSLVESAWLVRRMRFGRLTLINSAQMLVRSLGQITLASLGFGVFSLILPTFPAVAVRVIANRLSTPRLPLQGPNPTTWLPMWRDTLILNANSLLNILSKHGAILLVSLGFGASATGLFFWAHSLSSQVVYLLSSSLNGVFLSTFSQVNSNPSRQGDLYSKLTGTTTMLILPACLLQGLLAEDLFALLLAPEWSAGSPIFAILSLGLIGESYRTTSRSLLISKGYYQLLLLGNFFNAVAPLSTAIFTLGSSNLTWLAFGFAIGNILGSSVLTYIAIIHLPQRKRLVARKVFCLSLAGILALTATVLVRFVVDAFWPRLLASGATFMIAYMAAVRLFCAEDFLLVVDRISRFARLPAISTAAR